MAPTTINSDGDKNDLVHTVYHFHARLGSWQALGRLYYGQTMGVLPVVHNILEPVLVESLEPRLYVSLKWKKHTCGSGGVSITT
jgi:hypothetical protein